VLPKSALVEVANATPICGRDPVSLPPALATAAPRSDGKEFPLATNMYERCGDALVAADAPAENASATQTMATTGQSRLFTTPPSDKETSFPLGYRRVYR
jgi:hypothetical protein